MLETANKQPTLNQGDLDLIGLGPCVCPTALDKTIKAKAFARTDNPIYSILHFGDWPNLALYACSSVYHTSEKLVVFGTMEELSGDPDTILEEKVSLYMQSTWPAFARSPKSGLQF